MGKGETHTQSNSQDVPAIRIVRINTIVLHLCNGNLKDGQESETRTHHTQHTGPNVHLAAKDALCEGQRDAHDVDDGTDTTRDERGGDGVLLRIHVRKGDGEAKDHKRRSDETAHHGKGVLQSHECRQKHRKGLI